MQKPELYLVHYTCLAVFIYTCTVGLTNKQLGPELSGPRSEVSVLYLIVGARYGTHTLG